MEPRLIKNTKTLTTHDWPEDMFIQGGAHGVVGVRSTGKSYTTAFVEAFPDTFIRGEGATITEAEDNAWKKYQRQLACSVHEYEARGYTNGLGICKKCGRSESDVFTGEQLGQFCFTCGVGTTYSCYSDKAYWDANMGWVRDPGRKEDKLNWYCEEHKLFKAERAAYDAIPTEPIKAEDIIAVLELISKPDFLDKAKAESDKKVASEEETETVGKE